MKINLDKLYKKAYLEHRFIAGWSSPVARQAHNLKVVGSNPAPATNKTKALRKISKPFLFAGATLVLHLS